MAKLWPKMAKMEMNSGCVLLVMSVRRVVQTLILFLFVNIHERVNLEKLRPDLMVLEAQIKIIIFQSALR